MKTDMVKSYVQYSIKHVLLYDIKLFTILLLKMNSFISLILRKKGFGTVCIIIYLMFFLSYTVHKTSFVYLESLRLDPVPGLLDKKGGRRFHFLLTH
jgi:hypothetical protein